MKTFVEGDGKPKVCDKCTDARKDQPIIGMTILSGLRKTGDNEWSGGEILDPENGKVYKSKMSLADAATSSTYVASSASACSAARRPGSASTEGTRGFLRIT